MLLASQMDDNGYLITMEEINLSLLVAECVDDFTARFVKRQFLSNVTPSLFIKGDRLLLQMAVNNLIDNANKYSPKEMPVKIILKQENTNILLQVIDEGKGIAMDERQKIFEKFYRAGNVATKAAKGTGLGLYLAKRIALQHKANVFVTDNIATGSIFTIEFKGVA